MILGVYWFYKFPEDLYDYSFFKFAGGLGGHANDAAEIQARVFVKDLEQFLAEIKTLKHQYPKAYLSIKTDGSDLLINIGDYNLYDYHFQFAEEIEQILKEQNAISINNDKPFNAIQSYDFNNGFEMVFERNKHLFISLVSSNFKKHNAENAAFRIDCHLPLNHKKAFIKALTQICIEEHISVFYYNDSEFEGKINLMLFFTNGRQTKDKIQNVNINLFGDKVQHLLEKYSAKIGHLGGYAHYPKNGPFMELMKDQEFIINENY
ncbi:hypothetical protein [Chryseobacterium luquanense]|uniref:Uncharacterized protein n=1 Tax=Chryseobacterium luquanense TaxID=2983766 RepID=A0ABT3Y8F8_9FLAO|nr:hypothetical protein [Chryseobacterium luquanense]MCX8534378.1 hypothetical protein [Chryseobacterium luquanense]